jgi:membrane associated rhomboid family serine protease
VRGKPAGISTLPRPLPTREGGFGIASRIRAPYRTAWAGDCETPMGVWDRDYSKASPDQRAGGMDWRSYLPQRSVLVLIALHVLGFLVVHMIRHDAGQQAILPFVLRNDALHPAAILLHPLGNLSLLRLLFVVYVFWTLGGRIAVRFGAARLWSLYVVGTLISGVVYFGFAQLASGLAGYPLVIPAGALAAWALAAWRNLSDEMVSIFGRLVTVGKATAIGVAIVAGLVFFFNR